MLYFFIKPVHSITLLIVDMHDMQKQKRNFHVNMLRKWHAPPITSCFWTDEVKDQQDKKLMHKSQCGEKVKKSLFGQQLNNFQDQSGQN